MLVHQVQLIQICAAGREEELAPQGKVGKRQVIGDGIL